jgi:hypothetical protein
MIRDTLLANLSVALTGSVVSTSSELPWSAGNEKLYLKNMKKVYLDSDQEAVTEMFNCLNPANDVFQREITVAGYLAVDAKNPPNIDTVITKISQARLSVANCFISECSVTNSTDDDRLVYEFTYRFITI